VSVFVCFPHFLQDGSVITVGEKIGAQHYAEMFLVQQGAGFPQILAADGIQFAPE